MNRTRFRLIRIRPARPTWYIWIPPPSSRPNAADRRRRRRPLSAAAAVEPTSRGARMAWRSQLSRNLKELRFLFCQTSPASARVREFVHKNYKDLKTLNPKLPILIRECSGVEPQIWARYDMGVERYARLEGLSEEQINKTLEEFAKAGAASKQ